VTSAARRGHSVARIAAVMAWRAGRFTWAGTVGLAVTAGAAVPASAWVLRELIDDLTRSRIAPGPIVVLSAIVVLLSGLNLSIGWLSGLVASACQRAISVHVAADLYGAVNQIQGLRHFEDPGFQDELRLAERAADETPMAFSTMLSSVLQGGTTVAGYAGILIAAWPPMLPLLAAACAPAIIALPFLSRRQARTAEAMMGRYREWFLLRGLLSDPATVTELRLLGLGDFFLTRMVTALREVGTGNYLARRHTIGLQSTLGLLGGVMAAGGAAIVAVQAAHGRLSVGDFVIFLAAIGGTQGALLGIVNQTATLGTTFRLLPHYVSVLDKAADLADPGQAPGRPPAALRRGIELRDVWFRYADDGPWVLRGVTAELPAGLSTGLVGVNGAGKSTLIKLLCRLYDPQRGAILWDGTDLRDLDPVQLRRRLAVTFQDFLTYDLTVAENIAVGELEAREDRERIIAAASLVGLDETIRALPLGYDTLLSRTFTGEAGENGTLLSGGQNQRLALARTLMRRDADLMVLDEPSSGLDAEAEHQMHRALQRHRRGRTSLLVSHRLSAVREADRILVLSDGEVAEQGTHDELMALGGGYARLFTLQASGYADDRLQPLAGQST
jgi:ATP-binding cassette, subfamily B, bacterial